jgi:hypothetical protein
LTRSRASGSVRESCVSPLSSSRAKVRLRAQALGHQRRDLRANIAAVSSAAIAGRSILPWLLGFCSIIVLKRLAVSLDLLVQLCYLFGEPLAREDARLAGIAMEERAVDRDNGSADQAKLANQQHEAAVRRLQSPSSSPCGNWRSFGIPAAGSSEARSAPDCGSLPAPVAATT